MTLQERLRERGNAPLMFEAADRIDALERENAALRKDAEQMPGVQREYWESAVFTLIGHAEVLAGEGNQDMPRWFYRLAETIARAHVDEATAQRVQEMNEAAIDAAMAQR